MTLSPAQATAPEPVFHTDAQVTNPEPGAGTANPWRHANAEAIAALALAAP